MRPKAQPIVVGQLLDSAFPRLREPLALSKFQHRWRLLVGEEIARRAQPVALADGILQIGVSNSSWLQELCLRESELLHRLQSQMGEGFIRGLRFTLHSSLDEIRREEVRRPRRSVSLTPGEVRQVEEAVGEIRDQALAGTVGRLLRKAVVAGRRQEFSS
jgi:predicted nucleic acid-binding Zn ribbon protein